MRIDEPRRVYSLTLKNIGKLEGDTRIVFGNEPVKVKGPDLKLPDPHEAAKLAGLRDYGTLAQRYAREFDHKWLRGGAPAG